MTDAEATQVESRFERHRHSALATDTNSAAEGDAFGVVARRVRAVASWRSALFRSSAVGAGFVLVLTSYLQQAYATNSTLRYTASTFNTLAIMALAMLILGRWVRVSGRTFRRIAFASAVLLGFIILTGSAVRLTGSGLGCVDWPTCNEGKVVPALDDYHGKIEFGNRIVTGLCVFAAGLGVLASLVRVPYRRDLVKIGAAVVVAILGNAVLGGLTVLVKLDPRFVMVHFLLAIIALAAGLVLFHRAGEAGGGSGPLGRERRAVSSPQVVWVSRALTTSAFLTLLVGTVVTGSGPHAGDDAAARLGLRMDVMAKVHSSTAWLTIAMAIVMIRVASTAVGQGTAQLRRRTQVLLGVLVAQGAIGYIQWFTQVPAALVQVHVLGAVVMWTAVLWVRAGVTLPPLVSRAKVPMTATV
jgi:heme a synthase